MTPYNGYKFLGSSLTPRQTQMRVCHPTLIQKLRALDPGALDLCLLFCYVSDPVGNREDKCYWFRLLKKNYWSLHKQRKTVFHTYLLIGYQAIMNRPIGMVW